MCVLLFLCSSLHFESLLFKKALCVVPNSITWTLHDTIERLPFWSELKVGNWIVVVKEDYWTPPLRQLRTSVLIHVTHQSLVCNSCSQSTRFESSELPSCNTKKVKWKTMRNVLTESILVTGMSVCQMLLLLFFLCTEFHVFNLWRVWYFFIMPLLIYSHYYYYFFFWREA